MILFFSFFFLSTFAFLSRPWLLFCDHLVLLLRHTHPIVSYGLPSSFFDLALSLLRLVILFFSFFFLSTFAFLSRPWLLFCDHYFGVAIASYSSNLTLRPTKFPCRISTKSIQFVLLFPSFISLLENFIFQSDLYVAYWSKLLPKAGLFS